MTNTPAPTLRADKENTGWRKYFNRVFNRVLSEDKNPEKAASVADLMTLKMSLVSMEHDLDCFVKKHGPVDANDVEHYEACECCQNFARMEKQRDDLAAQLRTAPLTSPTLRDAAEKAVKAFDFLLEETNEDEANPIALKNSWKAVDQLRRALEAPAGMRSAEDIAEDASIAATEALSVKQRNRPWEDVAEDIEKAIIPFIKNALASAQPAPTADEADDLTTAYMAGFERGKDAKAKPTPDDEAIARDCAKNIARECVGGFYDWWKAVPIIARTIAAVQAGRKG